MKSNKRKIYILLTRFNDSGAKALRALTKCYYTHASIGLEEDMNTFYSFVYKGFIAEKITRYLKPEKENTLCKLYEIQVNERKYNSIKRMIRFYSNIKENLHYTRLGVVLCLMKIPFKSERKFFCSQFVAEILDRAGAAKLKRNSALYLPTDLQRLREVKFNFRGTVKEFANHFGLIPASV